MVILGLCWYMYLKYSRSDNVCGIYISYKSLRNYVKPFIQTLKHIGILK